MFRNAMQVVAFALGALLAVTLGSKAAGAQVPPSQEQELAVEEIVVTATRLADAIQELRRVPGQVYVITAEDIQRTKPSTVQEALRQVPGIVLYDQNGNRFQPLVDLRGFNAQPNPSISVFVDGVRVNEPDSNAVNFDLIPIQDVERIEVLPGASAVFGQNALGGVINIVTKRGTKTPQTTVEGALGSFNHYRVSANTSGPLPKGLDYYLSFGLDRESGFRDFSDGRVSKASGRLGYHPSDATDLSLSVSYVNDSLEQAGTLRLSDLSQDRRRNISPVDVYGTELSAVTLQGRQKLGWGFSLAGNGFYRQTSRELQNVGLTSVSRGITDIDSAGGALQLSHEGHAWGRLNRLSLGGEYRHGGVNSATSGTFGLFPFASKRLIDEDVQGFFAQDTFDLTSELALTAAVRYDSTKLRFVDELTAANSGAKWYGRTTPRAGLTYTPVVGADALCELRAGVPGPDDGRAVRLRGGLVECRPEAGEEPDVRGRPARPAGGLGGRHRRVLSDRRQGRDRVRPDRPALRPEPELPQEPAPGRGAGDEAQAARAGGYPAELHVHGRAIPVGRRPVHRDGGEGGSGSPRPDASGERDGHVPPVDRPGALPERPIREPAGSAERRGESTGFPDPGRLRPERAGPRTPGRQFTWFLQGNNLTDKKYETFGIVSGGDVFLMPAAGINVLGGLTIRFENYY